MSNWEEKKKGTGEMASLVPLAPRAGLEPLEDRCSCAIYGVFLKSIVQIGRLEGNFPVRGARTRYTHPLTTRHS